MRILLAEDEKALSKAMVKIFEKNNYSPVRKLSGSQGLKAPADSGTSCGIALDNPLPCKKAARTNLPDGFFHTPIEIFQQVYRDRFAIIKPF